MWAAKAFFMTLAWRTMSSAMASAVAVADFLRCDASLTQAFCLPADYAKQDRPEASDVMYVDAGFIVDDVSDVDDDSCAGSNLAHRFK